MEVELDDTSVLSMTCVGNHVNERHVVARLFEDDVRLVMSWPIEED